MNKYELKTEKLCAAVVPEQFRYSFYLNDGSIWTMTRVPELYFSSGKKQPFPAPCDVKQYRSGTAECLKMIYAGFPGSDIKATAIMRIERETGDVTFSIYVEGDRQFEIEKISYPAPLDFDAGPGNGYTVLPQMHGTLYPAGQTPVLMTGLIYERDGYMPLFGQVRGNSGYAAIFETPYDARYTNEGEKILPLWRSSLGRMNYPRTMRYCFRTDCDYNTIAKCYRRYLQERGKLITLKEKFARNPKAARIAGCPVIHTGIASHVAEGSSAYDAEHPERNDWYVPFDTRAEQLRTLKKRGLDKAYTHFDGWGKHGYDNLHPSPFPPHEKAGGPEGMARLADTCRELGYIFGIHDQYRDYYYDNPDFDIGEAVTNADGSHAYYTVWCGGGQTYLCSALQLDYVRRNYDEFRKLGINVEASYLDVFSVVELDECFNPDHIVTREGCAKNRRECLDLLTDRGIIPSSEEATDCIIPSMILCHHAPLHTTKLDYNGDAVGVPIPLLSLVYHDCLIVPWIGLPGERGGWSIPNSDCAYSYAILYGQPVYCHIDADEAEIAAVKTACGSAEKLIHEEMVRHEFLDGSYRKQRTYFSDGTVITADLDDGSFTIGRN